MTNARFMLLFVFLLIISIPALCSESPTFIEHDYWMGIYYGDTKIGYLHTTFGPGKYQGNDVLQRQDYLRFRYVSKGIPIRHEINHILHVDKAFMPINEAINVLSYEPKLYSFRAEFNYNQSGRRGYMQADEQPASEYDLPFVEGEKERVIAGTQFSFAASKLEVGKKHKIKHFIINGLRIKESRVLAGFNVGDCELEVLRKETLKVGGTEYQTIVVSESYKEGMITSYFTENGEEVRRMDRANNIFFIREDKDKAMEIDKGDGPDLSKIVKQ